MLALKMESELSMINIHDKQKGVHRILKNRIDL
jgi:hypothetical protein